MVKAMEGKISTPITPEGVVALVYRTILHEAQHNAEVKYDKTLLSKGEEYDENSKTTEAGNVFEIKAFGDVANTGNIDEENEAHQISRKIDKMVDRGTTKPPKTGGFFYSSNPSILKSGSL